MKYFAPPKKIPVDAHVHIDIGIRMTLWASDRLVSPSAQNLNVAPKTFFYVRATFFRSKIPVDAHVHIDIGIRMTLWASDRLVSPSAQNLNVAPKTFFYVRATFF